MRDDDMVFVWILIGIIVTLLGAFVLPNIFIWRKRIKDKKIDKKVLKYFKTAEFSKIKNDILNDVIEFNDLNLYLGELKQQIPSIGINEIIPKKKVLSKDVSKKFVYECNSDIIDYAKYSAFACLCEKFDINVSCLPKFEEMYNIFLSIENGTNLLKEKRAYIFSKISCKIPDYVKVDLDTLYEKLHFDKINEDIYFPKYTFKSRNQNIDIILNKENLVKLIKYLSDKNKTTPTMSEEFRTNILKRDYYTCCSCGRNNLVDITLFLGISPIKSMKYGGKIEEDNYETLCWYCNREKFRKSNIVIKLKPIKQPKKQRIRLRL